MKRRSAGPIGILNFGDWRMEKKLLVVFVFLVVLPIAVLSYISSSRYSQSIEKNTITYVSELSDKMMVKLDDYIEDVKQISIIPSYLDVIKSGLQMSNQFYESWPNYIGTSKPGVISDEARMQLDIQNKIGSSIYFINTIKKGTNTVYVFDRYGHVYSAMKNNSVRTDLSVVYDDWKERAESGNGAPILVSTQEVPDFNANKRYVFTIVREIMGSNFISLGMIAIDANISVIENIVKDLDKATQGTTLIVDKDNQVIFDSQKRYLSQNLSSTDLVVKASETEGSFNTKINGEEELTIYRQSPETGWKVFITIPQKKLMADAVKTRNYTIALTIGIVCFAMMISFILIFALTRPLRSLVRLMKQVQSGNFQVVFPVRRRDEVGMVGNAFNRMIMHVGKLIDDIHEIEQRKKEVELESLQHQINPHFIYNTLESIRMTAVLHDDTEVEDMSMLLGKLIRYSIHQGQELVSIEQEWVQLQMYVQLLNYRYGNRFTLELPTEDFSDIITIKLLFQPIVENSISHGLDEAVSNMRIVIGYEREGTDHVFTISDNGSGMDEQTLQRLRESLDEVERSHGGGIGVRNVHERIKLRYGNGYGLKIDSILGKGTVVTVRLPAERRLDILGGI